MAPREPESHPEVHLLASNSPSDVRDPLPGLFEQAYQTDKTPSQILQAIQHGNKRHPEITLSECENLAGLLYYCNRLYVPASNDLRLHLMRAFHDTPEIGRAHV